MVTIIVAIIGWIITIAIAIYTVKSSAKDTAKKIAALEESTTKQIESIKGLTRIQIEITSMQLRQNLVEARLKTVQTLNKQNDFFRNDSFAMNGVPNEIVSRMHDRQDKERNLSYDKDFYTKQMEFIEDSMKSLEILKKDLMKQ